MTVNMKVPTTDSIIAQAIQVWEKARDQGRIEAIGTIAKALLKAYEEGGNAAYDASQQTIEQALLKIAPPRTKA